MGRCVEIKDNQYEFVHFVVFTRGYLQKRAYSLCGDWNDAEDLVQITLMNIYIRWGSLRDHPKLGSYARKTLFTTYLSEHRRPFRKHEIISPSAPELEIVQQPIDERITLVAALERLDSRQRAMVLLRFWGGFTTQEVAEALDCSTNTVTSGTRQALKSLRRLLIGNEQRLA